MTVTWHGTRPQGRAAVALIGLVALALLSTALFLWLRAPDAQPPVIDDAQPSPRMESPAAPKLPEAVTAEPASLEPAAATAPRRVPDDSQAAAEHPAHVDVVVVDPDGNPVEDAEVLVCERAILPSANDLEPAVERLKTESTHDGVLDADEFKRKTTELLLSLSRRIESAWDAPSARYTTDTLGSCRVALTSGDAEILAQQPDLGTSGIWSVSTYERPENPTSPMERKQVFRSEARLTLRQQAVIDGLVLDSTGQPLAAASVDPGRTFGSPGRDGTRPRKPPMMTTSSEGRFRMIVDAPSTLRLTAKAAGVESPILVLPVRPGQTAEAVLRFGGAFRIAGRILDEHGQPVVSAKVQASGSWDVKVPSVTSGADGSYAMALAEAGEYSLVASKDGLVQDRPVTVTLSDDDPHDVVDVAMVLAGRIGGQVRWSTGEPIARCMVSAQPKLSDVGTGDSFAASNIEHAGPDGRFAFEAVHPDQLYNIEAFESVTAQAEVRDVKAGTLDVVLVVDRKAAEGVPISLMVTDADSGAAVPRFTVRHSFWINGVSDEAKVVEVDDSSGQFILKHCKPGSEYGFMVEADGYGRLQIGPVIPTVSGAQVIASLGRRGAIRVSVADAAGQPMAGALVVLAEALSETVERFDYFRTATADSHGVAIFADEPPGRYAVLARSPPLLSDLVRVDLLSGRTVDARAVVEAQAPPGELQVSVRDADGVPIPGVEVMSSYLTDIDAQGEWRSNESSGPNGTTAADGQCLLPSLAPGLYWVYVQSDATRFISPKQAQVFRSQRAVLEFTAEMDDD